MRIGPCIYANALAFRQTLWNRAHVGNATHKRQHYFTNLILSPRLSAAHCTSHSVHQLNSLVSFKWTAFKSHFIVFHCDQSARASNLDNSPHTFRNDQCWWDFGVEHCFLFDSDFYSSDFKSQSTLQSLAINRMYATHYCSVRLNNITFCFNTRTADFLRSARKLNRSPFLQNICRKSRFNRVAIILLTVEIFNGNIVEYISKTVNRLLSAKSMIYACILIACF